MAMWTALLLTFSCLLSEPAPSAALLEQTTQAVDWTFSLEDRGEGNFAVVADAEVAEGWFVYSQFVEDGGPVPTLIGLSATTGAELGAQPTESGEAIQGFDPYFDMEVVKYADAVRFEQTLRLPTETSTVEGYVEFMACTKTQCLPPRQIDISLNVSDAR